MSAELTSKSCIEDLRFQDWLAGTEIVLRTEKINPYQQALILDRLGKIELGKRILSLLLKNQGRLVSPVRVTRHLYRSHDQELQELMYSRVEAIKNRLGDENMPLVVPDVGMGVGISRASLTAYNIRIMYLLWQRFGSSFPEEELVATLYKTTDDDSRTALRAHISRLRQVYLANSAVNIHIESAGRGGARSYSILSRHDERVRSEIHVPRPEMPDHLDFRFQDWLAKPDAGILKREEDRHLAVVKQNETLTSKEVDLLRIFNGHWGYLLDKDYLSYSLGEPDSDSQVATSLIFSLRKKLTRKETIFNVKDVGWGIGIESFSLTYWEVNLLNFFWRNGVFIKAEKDDICKFLYGSYSWEAIHKLNAAAAGLRQKLVGTNLEIVSIDPGKSKGSAYVLNVVR